MFGIVRRTRQDGTVWLKPDTTYKSDTTYVAFACALLWLVHPLQTESVTCVIQRTEVLLGLFYLLTLYAFVRSVERDARVWRVVAVVACLASAPTHAASLAGR